MSEDKDRFVRDFAMWVREELNAGVVRRINNASKLIPVVIGDVDESRMPESSKTVVWERVWYLDNYPNGVRGLVTSALSRTRRRPGGTCS